MALNFKKYYLVLRQVCLVEYMAFSFKKYYLFLRQVCLWICNIQLGVGLLFVPYNCTQALITDMPLHL